MAITFVFCIESGPLEAMTIRAVESLRRWGGNLSNSPVFAVQPRFGPPLDRATLRRLADLDARYMSIRPERKYARYAWSNFLNKPYALLTAEQASATELIVWMDSDVLITGGLCGLQLAPEHDFAAIAPIKGIATSGPDDPNQPYWNRVGQIVGVDIQDVPFIQTQEDDQRIRLYWNSGVFVYRTSTGYARIFRDACLALFDARVAHRKENIFYNDQVALALTSARMRWGFLPGSHNYSIAAWKNKVYSPQELHGARVLHYHDFMSSDNWPRLLDMLEPAYPEMAEFLRSKGPIREGNIPWKRAIRSTLKNIRIVKRRSYLKSCQLL